MIDKLIIQQRLSMIGSYLEQLNRLAKTPKKVFLLDKDKSAAAESYLRRSLEAIFDIGRHILAKSGGIELSMEYKSIARGLGDKGIVSKQMSNTLSRMAGYRNRMVHMYNLVTEEELYIILQNNLNDISKFVKEIKVFLDEQEMQS